MPGGHWQFLYWFTNLVPLLIEMIGLPSGLTFWIYGALYPFIFLIEDRSRHHFVLLFIVAWLNIIGPRKNFLSFTFKEKQDNSLIFIMKVEAIRIFDVCFKNKNKKIKE